MLTILRQRSFALLWSAGLISMIGDWALIAALPFYMFSLTGSALATSGLLLAYIAPQVLFSAPAGVFVDRWDRKRTMVAANLLRAPLMLLLLFAGSPEAIWVIYLVAFAEATIGRFFSPAENALLPQLVAEEHLVAANSMNALNDNLARLAGPAIGGVLLGVSSLQAVALVDAASYLLSAALIMRITVAAPAREQEAPEAPARRQSPAGALADFWKEWVDGLRLVWRHRLVRSLFTVMGLAQVADTMLSVMLVVFVQVMLGAGAAEFGAILTARGIGGLLGGVVMAQWGHMVSPARLLSASLVATGLSIVAMICFPRVPLALAIALAMGVPVMGWLASSQTLMQSSVDGAYLGRVYGAYGTSLALLGIGGTLLGGSLGERFGAQLTLGLSGALTVAAGLLAALLLVRRFPAAGRLSAEPNA